MTDKSADDIFSEPITRSPAPKSTEIASVQKTSHAEPLVQQSTADKQPIKMQFSSSSLLLNFEQKQTMSHKSLENIFDSSTEERDADDDDIFASKSSKSSSKKQQQPQQQTQSSILVAQPPPIPIDSVKEKETPSLFDSSSLDDFDLFTVTNTKNSKHLHFC